MLYFDSVDSLYPMLLSVVSRIDLFQQAPSTWPE